MTTPRATASRVARASLASPRRARATDARVGASSSSNASSSSVVERAVKTSEVKRSNVTIASCEYEVVRVERELGRGPRVFVVPGNPGVASFYETFASSLSERLDARAVDVVGYLGHTERDRPGRREWFTLDEQKAHVRDYVDATLRASSDDGRECVVVGHSIGAHLALFTAKELGFDRIDGVVGLMPFLHVNRRSALQRALGVVTRLNFLAHAIGGALDGLKKAVPFVRAALLRRTVTKNMDAVAAEITGAWLRWQSLINMVFMGRTEFVALVRPIDECEFIASANAPGRFAALYAHDDHWAPLHQRDALEALGVDVSTVEDDIRHDFVVVDASARLVAQRAVDIIYRLAHDRARHSGITCSS